jgi:DNA-binding MarR family transcriptional regulator
MAATVCPGWKADRMVRDTESDTGAEPGPLAAVQAMPGHLLRRFQQIAVSMFLKECDGFDLTPLQFATLAAMSDAPNVDQAQLGGRVALDRTTIGVVLRKLEERGLATRITSAHDRRSRLVRITPAGAELLKAAMPSVERVQDHLLEPLTADERVQLVRLMERVVTAHNGESRAPLRG